MNNRISFNNRVDELGLTVTNTTSDGWYQHMVREDGLNLWRCIAHTSEGRGPAIQTALIVDGRFTDHKPYLAHNINMIDALDKAVKRK